MFEQVLGRDRGFLITTDFLILCRNRGSLCHDMVLRFHAVARSLHKGSLCFVSLS